MWDIIIGIVSKCIDFVGEIFKAKKETAQQNKAERIEDIGMLKQISYLLSEFDGAVNIHSFKQNAEDCKMAITRRAALAYAQDLEIHKDFEQLRDLLGEIVELKIRMDGGMSFAELKELVKKAKSLTDTMIDTLKKG